MGPSGKAVVRAATAFLAYGVAVALVCAPLAAERAAEHVRFQDRIGTVPVEVSLSHNGVSTLDTGVLGRLYWKRTGTRGFGAYVRVTGTPEAGGTLSSYVSPQFVSANAAFVTDPGEVARAYGDELRRRFWRSLLLFELGALVGGGLLLSAVFRARLPSPASLRRGRTVALAAGVLTVCLAGSTGAAVLLLSRWEGSAGVGRDYPMPGVDELSFSSPQALEIARQVRPFIEKNSSRIREGAEEYEVAAEASLRAELARRAQGLAPRPGEQIVIAEADPQGSRVGTSVRTAMYELLRETLGDDAFAFRTISGDITSNGTVAESGFVADEVDADGDLPTVVVTGDHDTETTVGQLADNDVINPDHDVTDVGGIEVVAANDPEFKALFGGLVFNESGVTEGETGADLREELGSDRDRPVLVLVHQPRAAAGYLGIDDLSELDDATGRATTPWDDGIPDLPPGIINVGHLHDFAPPKVIWNTDGDEVTWTVVNQLGTSGGVEENPTYNRFSTPSSVPLKTLSVQLQYVDTDTGLQTGYATIDIATDGTATISGRADLGT